MIPTTSSSGFVIAIDGPVASGKGAVSKALALALGAFNFDTGAMYRAFALWCLRKNILGNDTGLVIQELSKVNITFGKDGVILLNGEDVTGEIRDNDVSVFTPTIAAIAQVREEMVKRQQAIIQDRISHGQIVIVDARDAATVIAPNAKYKFYIWATEDIRAQRRRIQQGGNKSGKTLEEVLQEVKNRDASDEGRAISPLVKKEDAISLGYTIIDTSHTTVEGDVKLMLTHIQNK